MLTDDMARLRGEIEAMRGTREAFIEDLRRGTEALKGAVSGLREGFRDARVEMGERMKGDHQAFVSNLQTTVCDLQTAVSEMQAGFRDAHAEMAERTRADRQVFISDIKADMLGLRTDASRMQEGFRDACAEMARETETELSGFLSGLQESVSGLKNTVADLRQNFLADIGGGRDAWSGPSPGKAVAVEGEQAETEERMAEPQPAEETPGEVVPDDLTAIRGIGLTTQGRLNDAGIYTYAHLARTTPEGLHRALGSLPPRARVENWIIQSRKLAE